MLGQLGGSSTVVVELVAEAREPVGLTVAQVADVDHMDRGGFTTDFHGRLRSLLASTHLHLLHVEVLLSGPADGLGLADDGGFSLGGQVPKLSEEFD